MSPAITPAAFAAGYDRPLIFLGEKKKGEERRPDSYRDSD